MENYIGKRLDGRYEILELIGAGGMANVYKANDRLESREVAVKILREEFLDNDELVRRFKNESKAIGMLSHPNIVRVFDVNFSDSVQYIVMELLDGITLKEYIEHRKPLGWKDTLHFTVQVLRALQHAHDRGIVHRDIKPQNIMLQADGSIKVMDFGIARFSRSETRTVTNKAIGSVHYISPEQARGEETDAKADIYSVGIMMYEMLTGELPFESDSAVSVALKQISDVARAPHEIVSDIPEGIEEITMKAMAKETGKRYQSAAQMLRDIDEFKKNPSIVFAYKYFTADNVPRVSDLVDSTFREDGEQPDKADKKDKKDKKDNKPGKDKKSKKGAARAVRRKKSRALAITTALILGVTVACVICTGVLLSMAFGLFEGESADVELPNFDSMMLDAVRAGNVEGFKFHVVEEYNSDERYPVGTIFDQRPYPPKTVKAGSEVTLYVSKGPEIVTIPDVVDMMSGEAAQLLHGMRLVVRMEQKSDASFGSNKVVEVSPAPNTEVEAGSEVVLYINTIAVGAASSAAMPQLVGLTYQQARGELAVLGLQVGTVTFQDHESPKGTIVAQSQPENKNLAMGTKIDLVVSNGITKQSYTIPINLPYSVRGNTSFTAKAMVGTAEIGSAQIANNGPATWNLSFEVTGDDTIIDIYAGDIKIVSYTAFATRSECTAGGYTTAPEIAWQKPAPVDPTLCTECGQTGNTHATTCSRYVAPAPDPNACNCGAPGGTHASTCPQYVAPPPDPGGEQGASTGDDPAAGG